MKKTLVAMTLFVSLLIHVQPANANPYDVSCERLIITLLTPKIQEQLNNYYSTKLTSLPMFAPYLRGSKLETTYYSSHIEVKATVIPFIGPHLSVGKDLIKFKIDNTGKVTVTDYKHVEDYKLPPHKQNIIK